MRLSDDAIRHRCFGRNVRSVFVWHVHDEAASEESIRDRVGRERVIERLRRAGSEERQVRIGHNRAFRDLGGAAYGVEAGAGAVEPADAFAESRGVFAGAAHRADETLDLVRLEERGGVLCDQFLERFAARKRLGVRLRRSDEIEQPTVCPSRRVLADARLAEGDQVDVRARAVGIGVGASCEVGEHRGRSEKRERAVGTVRLGERVVRELIDEARHVEELVRERAGVLEVQGVAVVLVCHMRRSFPICPSYATSDNAQGLLDVGETPKRHFPHALEPFERHCA